MFGSRKTTGAISMPAIAPIGGGHAPAQRDHPADADAHQPRRFRIDCGGAHGQADARVAKEEEEQHQHEQVTPIMPAWWALISRCRTAAWFRTGVGNGLIVKSQMKPARLLKIDEQRDEHDDVAEDRARCRAA